MVLKDELEKVEPAVGVAHGKVAVVRAALTEPPLPAAPSATDAEIAQQAQEVAARRMRLLEELAAAEQELDAAKRSVDLVHEVCDRCFLFYNGLSPPTIFAAHLSLPSNLNQPSVIIAEIRLDENRMCVIRRHVAERRAMVEQLHWCNRGVRRY